MPAKTILSLRKESTTSRISGFVLLSAAIHLGVLALAYASQGSAPGTRTEARTGALIASEVYIVSRTFTEKITSKERENNPAQTGSRPIAKADADNPATKAQAKPMDEPVLSAYQLADLADNDTAPIDDPDDNVARASINPRQGPGDTDDKPGNATTEQGSDDYLAIISGLLSRSIYYPVAARRSGTEGSVVAGFVVDESGVVKSIEVTSTSGSSVLDGAALRIIERVSPLPPPPGGELSVELPLTFSLKGP